MLLIQELLLSFLNGNNATGLVSQYIFVMRTHIMIFDTNRSMQNFSEIVIFNLKIFVHFVKNPNNKCMQ